MNKVEVLAYLLAAVVVACAVWVLAAFIFTSFDPLQWGAAGRAVAVSLWVWACFIMAKPRRAE